MDEYYTNIISINYRIDKFFKQATPSTTKGGQIYLSYTSISVPLYTLTATTEQLLE